MEKIDPITVHFEPLRRAVSVHEDETILDAARRAGAPIGNSCGGIGVCARCRVRVVDGAEHLSPPTAIEQRIAGERRFKADERLACQAVVLGMCTVTTSYW